MPALLDAAARFAFSHPAYMQSEVRLADEDFWGLPLQAAQRLLDELQQTSAPEVRLWAPAFVPLDARRELPVYAGVMARTPELERLAFFERASVFAVDLATGQMRAVRFGKGEGRNGTGRRSPSPGFEGGLGPASGAVSAQVARCVLWDATTSTPPWPPGRYRLTAIAADRVSNDVVVEMGRSPTTVDAAARANETGGALQAWPPPDPAGGLPRYHAAESSLSPPVEPGVALAVDRVVTAHDGARCTLRGALSAPARAADRAPHGALIPVTLVITASEAADAFVVPMRIPSFDRLQDASPDARVTAHFAVDLLRLASLTASPQTYFVYAFTADGHAGPHPVAVVAA